MLIVAVNFLDQTIITVRYRGYNPATQAREPNFTGRELH
jgi:hypothetical protein